MKPILFIMFFITATAALFIDPVQIDWFKDFVFTFPVGIVVSVLLVVVYFKIFD